MNKQLVKLSEIADKPARLIVGLMSGTSLDGLDIALCKCSENTVEVLEFKTLDYSQKLRSRIRAIQSRQEVNLQEICILNTELAHLYSTWIIEALKEWGVEKAEIDLIASHGQTIYHNPSQNLNSTLQIVDGDHIAVKTGIITISDFRQKHTAAGGEGAPLAALMDEALFKDDLKHRLLLNLGGIANFTWLPSRESGEESITSDTGPANSLINEAAQKYFNKPYDENGDIARSGNSNSELLRYLLLEPYFRKPFPKTTGQEEFNLHLVEELMQSYQVEQGPNDLIATLTELTIHSITRALDKITGDTSYEIYISGGGISNPVVIEGLRNRLPGANFKEIEKLGIPPDAKEAALMAFLANEMVLGNSFHTNSMEVNLGKVSFPV
ncbi:MAG: anhydro-N-acetylmuramic acid kinase [Balneolaceae bacterium]